MCRSCNAEYLENSCGCIAANLTHTTDPSGNRRDQLKQCSSSSRAALQHLHLWGDFLRVCVMDFSGNVWNQKQYTTTLAVLTILCYNWLIYRSKNWTNHCSAQKGHEYLKWPMGKRWSTSLTFACIRVSVNVNEYARDGGWAPFEQSLKVSIQITRKIGGTLLWGAYIQSIFDMELQANSSENTTDGKVYLNHLYSISDRPCVGDSQPTNFSLQDFVANLSRATQLVDFCK